MGKLMMIGKVAVVVRNRDHNPPHFHVIGPDFDVQVTIDPVAIMNGNLPKAVWVQVRDWAMENRAALVAEWNAVNPNYPIK
ncbi:DUF4160 domain-containing protein [Azospirillum argentinense]|uniref:DUF4160 domain-containing protein n=1 Tax=Azospirillum argentinense TaxID=2970906 RepID=UPI0032DEF28C